MSASTVNVRLLPSQADREREQWIISAEEAANLAGVPTSLRREPGGELAQRGTGKELSGP